MQLMNSEKSLGLGLGYDKFGVQSPFEHLGSKGSKKNGVVTDQGEDEPIDFKSKNFQNRANSIKIK